MRGVRARPGHRWFRTAAETRRRCSLQMSAWGSRKPPGVGGAHESECLGLTRRLSRALPCVSVHGAPAPKRPPLDRRGAGGHPWLIRFGPPPWLLFSHIESSSRLAPLTTSQSGDGCCPHCWPALRRSIAVRPVTVARDPLPRPRCWPQCWPRPARRHIRPGLGLGQHCGQRPWPLLAGAHKSSGRSHLVGPGDGIRRGWAGDAANQCLSGQVRHTA